MEQVHQHGSVAPVTTLHVVLRTCDTANVHNDWRRRYHSLSKQELIVGCLRSLVRSIQYAKNVDCQLSVIDDHSTAATLELIRRELNCLGSKQELISLDVVGYNYSAWQQWSICKSTGADLWYSPEDDYLHCTSAIQEMVDSWLLFSDRLKRTDIVLYPFDEPSEYNPPSRQDYIVHGSARHWRTGVFSTNVLMSTPQFLQQNWQIFETLALKYNGDYLNPRTEHFEESNTIWRLWQNNQAIRFNPIPSLALHMQFEQQKDPFINWEKWWTQYAV